MATREGINLPNGRFVELAGIPPDVSQAELQDKLIRNGLATIEEFEAPEELNWLQRNMELPVGMGGALAGAGAGFLIGGPVGAVVGSVVGGATGSGAGSLISDELADEELDYAKAAEEALISAGFDIATLGLGKIIKPGYYAAKAAMGFTPKEVAEQVVKVAEVQSKNIPTAGSLESLRQSQQILQQATDPASLTKSQTGRASGAAVFAEKIADIGILSSGDMTENAIKVNKATQEALNAVTDKVGYSMGQSSEELGRSMYDIVEAGKNALQGVYGQGLTDLGKQVSRKTVSPALITNSLQKFIKKGDRKTFNKYDDDTLKYVDKLLSGPLDTQRMSAKALLDLDKKIAAEIRDFSNPKMTKVYNPQTATELGELTDILKTSFINTLKQVDPKIAKDYKALKNSYSVGRRGLLPELNKSFIVAATGEQYNSLGKMLNSGVKSSNARAMMNSIDEAYKQIAKSKKGVEDIAYATATDAKEAVKQSYLTTLIPNMKDPAFDINDYARLADKFSNPDQDAMLKVVAGKDYGRVKQLFNLMDEAAKKPEGNVGTLVLRGKEFGSLEGVAKAAQYTGMGAVAGGVGLVPGLLTAGAVFLGPKMLAAAASNPKAVNKLLAFEKMTFKDDKARDKAATLIVAEIMDGLNKERRAEIRNEERTQ